MESIRREKIESISIEEELKTSYLNYAVSVIMSRALPDVRDGLKPSQRRILVAMNDLRLGPNAKYRKCAKIAGDTSGNYHPHGEQVVYPTLCRMAQDFVMRYPLIDGQGNFGSIDGDAPAAMRYTEARMRAVAMEMLDELPYETVDMMPNYDETRMEPVVLPSRFPNLLCNGSSGIAVGMATEIPPHNLNEVVDALVMLIDNPDATVSDILKVMPGPDFPTGALICGTKGIREAYETGRSNIVVRARIATEESRGRTRLIVTEIPPGVAKSRILESIADSVRQGRLKGISDIRDESDREGMRVVIELRRDEEPEVVINQLYKHSPLQQTVSIILLAIDRGRPRTLNMKEMMQLFLDHRRDVVTRKTRFLLAKAEDRAHILEGLKKALKHIDEVIETIKKSPTVEKARTALMKRFSLSERQATAILEMRLQRLTGLEQDKINAEYRDLIEKIAYYRSILENPSMVDNIIKEELLELKKKYGDPRRTEIVGDVSEINIEDLIAREMMTVTITDGGYIKRMPISSYRTQGRGGKGMIGAQLKEGDFVSRIFVASTHDYMLFFTSLGKVHWLKVYDIPQMGRTARGRALVNLLELQKGESVTSIISVSEFDDRFLLMVTRRGIVKKTELAAFGNPRRGGIIALSLDEGDELVDVKLLRRGDEIVIGTRKGMAIRFVEEWVRPMGRTARGVKGISLAKGDVVQGVVKVDSHGTLLTVCERGYGKRTAFDEYRAQQRGGKGVIAIRTTPRNGDVVALLDVRDEDDIIVSTSHGKVIRLPVKDIRVISRATQGVRLVALEEGDTVVSVARVPAEEGEEERGGE